MCVRAFRLGVLVTAALLVGGGCGDTVHGTPWADGGGPAPGDAAASDVPIRDDLTSSPLSWADRVIRTADTGVLFLAFTAEGYVPPTGTEVLAARVERNPFGLTYTFHQINDGATSQAFWPASTVKVQASLAALHFIESQGFSSAATVTWTSGYSDRVDAIVGRAIRVSSNEDYDRTLRIAGLDHLNATWLSPERGFPLTVITGGYAGFEVRNPPGYTLTEGANSKDIPARPTTGTYTCASGKRNCTTLLELTDAVRRVVLNDEIAEGERFGLRSEDLSLMQSALCEAKPSFFAAGAAQILGEGTTICHKPGWYPGLDSLDHGVITGPGGDTYLLAVAVPDPGDSSSEAQLSVVASHVLSALRAVTTQTELPRVGEDGGVPIALERNGTEVRAYAAGASRLSLFVDGKPIPLTKSGDVFMGDLAAEDPAGKLITLTAFGGSPEAILGHRAGALP